MWIAKCTKVSLAFHKYLYLFDGIPKDSKTLQKDSQIGARGLQTVPKMVPKWYPKSLTHFFKWSFFIIFQVKRMATWPLWPQLWVPSIFFSEHISCQLSEKKRRPLSRDIYLPSFIFMIFCQIQDFHLWDKLHFLGTIEYSMVPKIFTIEKCEVSAF